VMGAIAFIMAIITGIPYSEIVIAATLPAIFYYYGLLIQVDAYAVKAGLRGLSPSEIPSARAAFKQGWPFVFGIVFLVVGLLYFQWGVKSAIYAAALLLIASFANRATMMTPGKVKDVITVTGYQVAQVMSVLMPVGFVILGFELTGSLTRLTSAIVGVAAANVWYVLLVAVVISFLFGMIGISFISYIVLAVVAIPAVVQATGMSVIGLHFFMIWWLLVGAINPPVAILAFIAAAVAEAPPMKTAWTATRLAAVTYFIPFFFVFEPALIFEGPILRTAYSFCMCMLGITVLGYGLEGYFPKAGNLPIWARVFTVAGGFLIAMPEWRTTVGGAMMSAITVAVVYWQSRAKVLS
ncbi:MAG: TRAP transporter large permease subunit, partial [Dehalococcoidia bacterium]|nr:TRAP transporter large permease subunit [Dehalococcoidia bacterium]